jgi:hypothetical protein
MRGREGAIDVFREHRRREAVHRVVRLAQDVYVEKKIHQHAYSPFQKTRGEGKYPPASSLNLITTPTGPKISSFTIFMSGFVFVKIVGSMKYP